MPVNGLSPETVIRRTLLTDRTILGTRRRTTLTMWTEWTEWTLFFDPTRL
jgi:hypothetical protein